MAIRLVRAQDFTEHGRGVSARGQREIQHQHIGLRPVPGELGRVDSDVDGGNDRVGRNGLPIGNLDQFFTEWAVRPGENLLPA